MYYMHICIYMHLYIALSKIDERIHGTVSMFGLKTNIWKKLIGGEWLEK